VEAWQSGDLVGLPCRGLVEGLSVKPAEWGPGAPVGRGPNGAEIQWAFFAGAWRTGGPVDLQSVCLVGLHGGGSAE
jgi:hypothetical protein